MRGPTARWSPGRVVGWSGRSQVDRVGLYTRQSLYVLLWATPLWFVLAVPPGSGGERLAVAVGSVVLTASATVVLRDVAALHPAARPLPWRSAGPFLGLCVLAVAGALALSGDTGRQAVLVVCSALV